MNRLRKMTKNGVVVGEMAGNMGFEAGDISAHTPMMQQYFYY
ncbi:hypothetical protein FACS1894154_12510 [Betaproteobacteria bacterium]|nr:hypothetical protein FACS1894154_12510 [Betaproteobacteria bacterium]